MAEKLGQVVGAELVPTTVLSADTLQEIVSEVKQHGAFCFDVETRGVLAQHPDVQDILKNRIEEHLATLKRVNDDIRAQNVERFTAKFRGMLALDPNRNEVFWLGIATRGKSWAIPMGHTMGKILVPAEVGDGSTVPPPGHRKLLKSGKESMAKAKYYIPPVVGDPPAQLTRSEVLEALAPIFLDPEIIKVGHNVKFDARSVGKYYGQIPPGPYVDTMLYQHVLNENLESYSLERLIAHNYERHDAYAKEGKLGKVIDEVPFDSAVRYVHLDVRWTWLLYQRLNRRIGAKQGLRTTVDLDCQVLRVLMDMETQGMDVDVRAMQQLGKDLDQRAMELLVDIYKYAPPGFNPDSNVQKAELLFNKKRDGGLGLTPSRKTPGGKPSVDAEALELLQGEHPVVDNLIEWAEIKKLKTTYVEGLSDQLVKGKLHPSFHLHRTKTGRLSCVSGDTLLHTSRGTFTFEDYLPQAGDLVPTHMGNWKPVVRKIYKGTDFMFSVHLSNGSVLKCTLDHKVLTPEGWVSVRDLSVGSKVYSYDCQQPAGQLGAGDQLWASCFARQEAEVREIAFVGEMGVWDIEVADDHSYATAGFFNHNSSGPNLQNIPRDSSVRGLFVAGHGNLLLVADYDQIELRVMAMFSQDQNLLDIFQQGQDIHAGAAALLYGKDISEVTSEERQVGKGANFLTAYGGGAPKLARQTGLSMDVAQRMIDRYHEQFLGLTKWKRKIVAQARRDGFVTTLSGRRRRLPELESSDDYLRSKAERQAVNAVVQGSAADICKQAMIDVSAAFESTRTRLLVQVHDELVARSPLDEAYEAADLMSKAMGDGRIMMGVPLNASCHHAYSWSEAKGK